MEQEDRKKKLAAGKEKLAAFRKKRAKKKKAEDGAGVNIDSTQNSANGMEDGSLVNASSLSDLNSFTGESDQYSLTSGDEWSAEESDLQAAVHYQAKLTAATQRIAELEEALEGKQLALDRMVLETQLSDSSPHKVTEGSLSGGDLPNSIKGSVQELQDALEQRDKIIRQLTARLQETVAAKSSDASDVRPDYMEETQHLSQQVVLLQKQLTQAGETVEQQVAMCQMSVRALQEAKAQILALQGKVTEKNNRLQQLSYTLTTRSSEVMALKQREAELEQLVQALEQQAPSSNSTGESELSQSAASRAASLEQELERLGAEHAQSLKAVAELQQQLALSESARQSLASEKEEAVRKTVGLEEELDQLGQVRDDALEKMSDLERRVREGSALLGAECGSQSSEASERIAQLEREIVELSDEHRVHVDWLNQRHSSLEAQLAEQADLSDLKNVINSQQGEILSLHQQLKSTQEELSSSREQVTSLQDQLDQLQNKHKGEEEEAAGILRSFQLQVQTLREENARYQQQMALAQEQVHSFKDSLQSVSSLPTSDDVKQGEASPLESWETLDKLYAESDLPGQIQLLQKSYAHLLTQYTQKLEKKHQLHDEAQSVQESEETCKEQSATIQHLTAEVSRLQAEVDRLAAVVQEKDSEISKLSVHLQAVIKEKESLAFQLKEQEQLTEQQTLESDTLHRKMESRANTLLSEVTQCKEALKESESANLELQEKLDAQLAETNSLKLQLAASEDLMKQMQSKVNADDTRARLELVEAELQAALEDKKALSQLQALLEEKDLKLQAVDKEKEAAAEAVTKHEEGLRVVQLQLAEASQQHQAALAQQEQLVNSHHEEVLRLREHLKEMSVELQNTLLQKEQAEALLASTLDSKAREMQELQDKLDRKSKDLDEIGTEKEQLLSDLDSVTADKECEIQRIQVQLEQKAKEVEQLMSSLASAEVDRETEVQKIQVLLEEKAKEVERIIVEKEQLVSTFNLTEADINENFQDLQQKLDQKSEDCQTLLVEKEELANQQSVIVKELADLQESLLQKGQECDILLSENEQLREELLSKSSAHAREIGCLKFDLDQQTHKFEILLSDWDNLETEFHSRESAFKWEMWKISEKLNESVKELEVVRTELVDVKDAMDSKDDTIKNLHSEVKLLQEQLTLAETAGDEAYQDRQQALDVLQSQVHELKQDLVTTREENDSLLSRLAGQADMFKMKEEEMVTENNALNHQLEEVRSEAQETASQLQQQLGGLQGELESTRSILITQEDELSKLREEDQQQKETLDSLNESNTALVREKEQLVAKICSLEANVEEIQKELDSQVDTLQAELDGLRQDKDHQWSEFDKERVQLQEKNTVLKDQLDSCTSEIEQLQKSLKDAVAEQDKLKADMDTLQQQQDALQLDFSVQLEEAQSQVSSKESELQSLQAQLRDSSALLANQVQSLQEELAAAQAEVVQKDSILASTLEELTTAKSQMERLAEEKEMLKSNFDCCMEDMTQRAAENDNTIRQLQGRLMEASNNVDRDQGQMREMYESQLSELEDRLAAGDLELQRLEKIAESTNAEKEKLKEHLNGQIADLELTIQSAESELSHLREQMSKRDEAHKKEIADLKHSYEIQIMSVEENCQSLEKALAKQDSMMLDVSSRFERDRTEREKAYDQQLSEAYEQVRLHEMDVARVKRQLDEMRKDHQREQQELQKSMETQIFDLENKCVITMSELERMRQSLWSMEEDHSGETQALRNRIQELEALSHNQEKQISDLQDKLIQSSQLSDDSVSSLRESYQSEVAHLDGLNQQLSGDVENLQDQLKTMQRTQMQEAEALKHEHNQTMGVVQERCRRAEHYSQVLQSHMDSASGSADNPELFILTAETERLQQELAAAEASIAHLQLQLKETQASHQTKISELTHQVRTLTSDKRANSTHIEHLTEDLENEKQMLQESQMICQDLEEENKHLTAENSSLRQQAPQPHTTEEMESRFVSSEEDRTVTELKQQINHLTQELRRVQMRRDENCVPVAKEPTGFVAEGGFEPEPDSLGYLDLAVGPKAGEDYFVEETEPSKGPLKTRTKSVPSEMLVAVEDEQARMLATFQTLQSVAQRVGNNEGLLLETGDDEGGDAPTKSGDAGRFEPEEDSNLPSFGDGKGLSPASDVGPHQPADVIVDSFQPESQPITPITECPAGAPVLSFLPHPVGVLPETKAEGKFVEAVDSSTQTEKGDRDHPAEDTPDTVVTLTARQQPQAAENSGDPSQDANALDESLSDVAEAEFSQRLRSLQDQLEEEWVLKMRSQEVELRHAYDLELKEFQRETEHKCQQQIRQVRQETQASFVDAVRKMRKSMKKKQKEEQKQTKALKEKLVARSGRSDLGVPEETDDKKLGEIIKQLNDENQELQEVRDVLLEQIAIFQTQGRRHAMQHELQALISRGSRLSPSQSLKLTSGTDSDQDQASPQSSEVFEPVVQPAQVEPLAASESHALHSSGVVGCEGAATAQERQDNDDPASRSTPTAGSDDEDDRSEGSSVRDRFLEELEEMSQQSGQDLPLEWELTSTTVAHASSGGGAGAFERDQAGTGSVWEVFDGRCLRQDCRELESLKRQYEAEMEALRQQLEVQRESSDHVDHQLRSQYMQAMSSLREALQDSEQQKELDAVVGQLQELHQRQLQELNTQHLHDTALQVTAMRLTVEQVQASRLKLMEEEHHSAVQHLNKQHKEQLNALQARLSATSADGVSPLSASEELTQQYQSLVQRINECLEKEVLERLHGNKTEQGESDEPKTNGFSADIISVQQAEAIQQALHAQQEEVLSVRSRLLQEYEAMLQHRSEGVSQQTEDVQRLQDQIAELQREYEKQIAEFQARLSQHSEEDKQRQTEHHQRDLDLEEVKAEYEQRIADMERAFSAQIAALQQMAPEASVASSSHPTGLDVGDGGDTGQAGDGSAKSESNAESLRLAQERDYVHKTATLTAISDIDSDAADSSHASAEPESEPSCPSSKLVELQNALEEKTARVAELEQLLEEERKKVSDMVSQLDSASQQLSDLSSQLDQLKEVNEALRQSLEEKDKQLEQALQETAESQKLLQDLTEKEAGVQKEKEELAERLRQFQEVEEEDRALVTSTPVVEDELRKLRASLEEATSAMQAAEARELELREKLSEAEHQHTKVLEELRQELEHQVQMERETLQSEFQVQLEVELRRQASELEQQFAEKRKGSDSSLKGATGSASATVRTVSEADDSCDPDLPHSGEVVLAALTASQNVPIPSTAGLDPDSQENGITEPLLTCQHYQPLEPSLGEGKSENRAGDSQPAVCEEAAVQPSVAATVLSGAESSPSPSGANAQPSHLVRQPSLEVEQGTDFDRQLADLCRQFETEKTQLVEAHQARVAELEALLKEAEDKYDKLKEDVEEREGAGVDTLVKDRYDMELELAKTLMQQEFDDTLQAEKKKFVDRHRKLMDDFMSDRETEAAEIKQKHQQELEDLKSSLSAEYNTQIAELQVELQQLQGSATVPAVSLPDSADTEKSESGEDAGGEEGSDELSELRRELQEVKEQLQTTSSQHAEALAALREEYEARISELKSSHQEELEAAALDTDVMKSELERAHQAELQRLQEQLLTQAESSQTQEEKAATETGALKSASQSSRDGERTPDVRSSLEYEETDEEESVHSFSSMLGKTRSFAEVVKSTPPSSPQRSPPQHDERVKQLEAQVERLTQQLAQQQPPHDAMTATKATTTASPPPPSSKAAATATSPPPRAPTSAAAEADGGDQNLVTMLQSDLDRISAERDAVQQTNNRLLQLLSDSVHTYVEVEDTINRRLHSVVASSAPRPSSPAHLPRPDNHGDLVTPRGAGLSSFSGVAGDHGALRGAAAMSSPQSDRSWKQHDADTSSPTLEETSILSNATDEGLDMSQRLTESIFIGPDIDAEGEEIVSDARGRLQNAVSRLLEMIERTTQQLLEAKATQSDLLETMATRTRDNDELTARLRDLEEQVRQEVAAKEYLGLELHKAEGLISGYSSEREALEEQLQSLEEQKEVLAGDLETTRSRLREFQEATGELEARRQDVERQQTLLQENAGQEAQESAMAGGDAAVSEQKALLNEMNSLKQETREQNLQLQHRLTQAQLRLQERESAMEEMEKEQQRQAEELRRQVEDLRLQLENTERQLKSNKHFLDEQMTEREQEREEFQKEVEKLKAQLLNKEKQGDSQGRLQHEIQDLTEQLQARIESQMLMHQQARELQQSLEERELSAQDLRVWINTLERELDQRGDTEEQLKGRIQNLERRLTIGETEDQSDKPSSPVLTPRPDSPSSLPLSPTRPSLHRRESRISLEDELRRSRQAEEELVHEKEALQKRVQEQLLQISALRNQLDEMRHWTGPTDPNTSAASAADLRDQLDTEREKLEKKEEELSKLKAEQEGLEQEVEQRRQEVEQLKQQLQDSALTAQRLGQLEEEREALQTRIAELSNAGPFPPELLDDKNAEIEELRQQLLKTETDLGSVQAQLKEKEELVSDLQDTVHSLQRGESCLDVSLSFNEPVPLNASFTERTSLAQELDQTVGEREARIAELTDEVEQLTSQLTEQQETVEQLQSDKAALEAELQQRDEDLSQLQEEKTQKQEALAEKDSRLEQLVEQISGLQTEITSLSTFQVELQKDFDTVQSMLDEKEREMEALTKELLDSRSLPEGSDVSEAIKAELQSLKTQLAEKDKQLEEHRRSRMELQQEVSEKTEQLEKDRKRLAELRQELEELQRVERGSRNRAYSFPNLDVKPMEDQVRNLKAEVFHLEGVVKDKEELIRYLEEEKAAEGSLKEKDLADLRLQLQANQDNMASRVTELEEELKDRQQRLADVESQKQEELENLQQQLSRQAETVQQLEMEQQTLRQQGQEDSSTISGLQREVAQLEEQLAQAKSESIATDDVKALQERLQQANERVVELEQQLTESQTRLDQTATQLAEREEQIQQLQAEVQALQQEARQQQQQQKQQEAQTPDEVVCPKTPDSSEDGEGDERLKDVLSRAQHMQTLVRESLSSSLPISGQAEASSLSRWESEPGLSSSVSTEMMAQAQDTELWLRRQQRELASKNRELATVREELEAWLRRKDRAAPTHEYSASVMTMTLRLQEKEVLIASLKRELKESKELLAAAAEKSTAEMALASGSRSLSPQTQQQIAHLRSELQRARSALMAMQERSGSESESGEVAEQQDDVQKLEAELKLLRSSASMSAKDFVKKIQELREELTLEHQRHIREVQEAARQDLEIKLTELQSRHDHEMQQLQQLHQRKLQQALSQQQQELEKQHKTELNHLRVQQQQEIDRLRSEELASLTDASVAQRLDADISATQQMDQRMIGSLNAADDASSDSQEACPARIQALLDRLREAGEHILSVSELDFLRRQLSPPREAALQEAWEGEKLALVKTIHALKELLSQADRVNARLEEGGADWRSDLIQALVEVYKRERLGLEAELHMLRLQQADQEHAHSIKNLDNRLREQEQLHQSGLDAMLRAERQSLLTELQQLQSRLSQLRREQQDLQAQMTESLAQQEETATNKTWKLQREVQVLEYKLQQEKVIEEDLRKGLEAERRRVAELSAELSRDKGTLISVQSELQSTQLHLARTKDALEREQNRFTSVTANQPAEESEGSDALEEEREKNNHLADKLEMLRRQQSSLESDVGRSEAMRREREGADSRFIKELQAELAAEREQLHQAVEVAEEERRQRKQLQAEAEKERQQADAIQQELEKLRHKTKRVMEAEAAKLADLQRLVQQEQEKLLEVQRMLAERDATIHQQSSQAQQLQAQVLQAQSKCSLLEQQLERERQKAESLVTLMDSERQQQAALQEQEQAVGKQLRQDLSQAKAEAGEARRLLELEKSRSDSLRLELEHVQSELRAVTQHAGATERQLETEHSSTWNKLRVAQRDRDEFQVKVHELELELDRLQDRLRDLELELDRSRQRELEARHDVERHKLYPSASPRSAPTTPRGATDIQLQSRLNAFCQQIQSVGQRLQTLTIKQRDHNAGVTDSGEGSEEEAGKGRAAIEALLAELQALQKKMAAGELVGGAEPVASAQETEELQSTISRLQQEMEELQGTISRLREEKEELQHQLALLEDRSNIHTPRTAKVQEGMPQYVSDATTSDDEFIYERTVWASERLSLQMALDSAEHEIDRLKKELRSFRGRFNSEGFMVDADRDKMQRLYGKYLRAESFRKALVYQKKYLLLLLGGYQDSEQETLAIIATMGGQPSSTFELARRRRHRRLYTMFRSAARMVVAIFRMKYLVRKWRRATRVGSPVVSGRVSQHYGYVATPSSFSCPNNSDVQRASSDTAAHVHTLTRGGLAAAANGSVTFMEHRLVSPHTAGETGRRFYTPPTKESSQSSHRASTSPASSSARRQLMGDLDRSQHSSSGAEDSGGGGGTVAHAGTHDDFIQRLANLHSRLSASSQNGEPSQHRPAWR